MKVVIAGGNGFIGRELIPHFRTDGWEVIILSRTGSGAGIRNWDGRTLGHWARELEGADLLLNLAGRSVNCRYGARNRRTIYDSRLNSTKVLGEAIGACQRPPLVWINAASATIYRHAEDRAMDERTGEIGSGFSVDVCQQWERCISEARTPATRKITLRLAMVMGPKKGGVFAAFRNLARLGMAGTLGPGTQYMSWLHHEDLYGIIRWLLDHPEEEGVFNASAPQPLPNKDFMRIVRQSLGIPIGLPAMIWMLEVGAFFLRTETELLLKSRRVVPGRLLKAGYSFRFPAFAAAAREIAGTQEPV